MKVTELAQHLIGTLATEEDVDMKTFDGADNECDIGVGEIRNAIGDLLAITIFPVDKNGDALEGGQVLPTEYDLLDKTPPNAVDAERPDFVYVAVMSLGGGLILSREVNLPYGMTGQEAYRSVRNIAKNMVLNSHPEFKMEEIVVENVLGPFLSTK